jgi:hypothetical protein
MVFHSCRDSRILSYIVLLPTDNLTSDAVARRGAIVQLAVQLEIGLHGSNSNTPRKSFAFDISCQQISFGRVTRLDTNLFAAHDLTTVAENSALTDDLSFAPNGWQRTRHLKYRTLFRSTGNNLLRPIERCRSDLYHTISCVYEP